MGNRLKAEGVTDNWSYNDNNELQGYDGVSFQYDANGNTIQKNDDGVVTHYIYNIEDRLERVENGSSSLISKYYYDPFGRRLWKEVAGLRAYFVYADEGLVAEVDAAGNVVKSYGYRPNSTWTTDPLFMKVGSDYYFYQNNHLGTPQKLTAVNGAVVWSAKYSSYGKTSIDPSTTVINDLRFPGQYYDQETELHYNHNRYYDTKSGRYLSLDPVGYKGGLNLFAYTSNNPINSLDPLGLAWIRKNGKLVSVSDEEYKAWKAAYIERLRRNKEKRRQEYKNFYNTPEAQEFLNKVYGAKNTLKGHDPTKPWGMIESFEEFHNAKPQRNGKDCDIKGWYCRWVQLQ